MKRSRLVSLLCVAAVLVAAQNVWFFWGSGNSFPPPVEDEEAEPGDEDARETASAAAPVPIDGPSLAPWLAALPGESRSPFLTRAEAGVRPGNDGFALPRLAGTLTGASRRVAWIDGFPHAEGDVVRGNTVMRIERDAVWLESSGERVELRLAPEASADATEHGGELDEN